MAKRQRVLRPSKIEQHIYFTAQEHIDNDTHSIMRRRYVMGVEEEALDDEIEQLTLQLKAAKIRKTKKAAEIFALTSILERR